MKEITKLCRGVIVAVACLALLPLGCGSDDSSPTGGGGGNNPIPVSGTVAKGGINASLVNLHQFTANGFMGAHVAGPFTTGASGAWSGELPAGTTGPLLIIASGGTYTDEATSQTVTVGSNMYGILQVSLGIGNATPVSHAMVLNAQARVANGASLQNAVVGAISEITTALGYDPTSAGPVAAGMVYGEPDVAAQQNAAYTVLLAGISQLLSTPPSGFGSADTWDMVMGIAQDLSDGVLQGMDAFGVPVLVDPGPGTPIAWPSLDSDDISNLVDAANTWALANSFSQISNPDMSGFGDVAGGGGGSTPTGSISFTGAMSGSFTPTMGENLQGSLVWSNAANTTVTVSHNAGSVVQVGYITVGSGWATTGFPVANISVNGSTVTFSGTVLINILNPQQTISITGTMGYQ